ncbi:hypothetical protein JMG10_13345 [Nostoc ellipsosporum NOK]|nr:hypothetical protein [Nostoc ellipsosporum NOK]
MSDEQIPGASPAGDRAVVPSASSPQAVSPVPASIPSAADVRARALEAATLVADRCHGDRKPGAAPTRYAMIFQAAYAGAVEMLLPSTGVPCELCSGPVRLGHYVNLYDDIGETHADCDAPDVLPSNPTPAPSDDGQTMTTFRMVGDPLVLEEVTITPTPESSHV